MSFPLIRLLGNWADREPSTSLFVLVTAILLFGSIFARRHTENQNLWIEIGHLALAMQRALIFVGILGMFYFLLDAAYKSFFPIARSIAADEETAGKLSLARELWGGYFAQKEISVLHTTTSQIVDTIQGTDNTVQYINKTIVESVPQESISSFEGTVNIHIVDPSLNTYLANAHYKYVVTNNADIQTRAEFSFPIESGHYYEDLLVEVDGVELGPEKSIKSGAVVWSLDMFPQQVISVVVSYSVRGMDAFSYVVLSQVPIEDFSFKVSIDTPSFSAITNPAGDAVKKQLEHSGQGPYIVTWKINHAIMKPEVGIKLKSPIKIDTWQLEAAKVTRFAPRGVMLLGVTTVLTMLIFGLKINLAKLSIFLSLYAAQFLAVMGLDLLHITYLVTLPAASICAFFLLQRIYHDLPVLPQRLVGVITILFLLGYPIAGLLPDGPARNAFDAAMQAVLLAYLFSISLYVRIKQAPTVSKG